MIANFEPGPAPGADGARATNAGGGNGGGLAGQASAAPDPVAGKTVSEVFGEIVWLMTQDAKFKALPLSELEWLVMPPILLKQFHIFYAPPRPATKRVDETPEADGGRQKPLQPIGAVLFAMASDAVAAALDADQAEKLKLTAQDWRSGPHRRVVRVIAPFGGAEEMKAELLSRGVQGESKEQG